MILLLELIAITSIWCLGVKIVTNEGMILQQLGRYATRQVEKGNIIWDALIHCEWCLPSVHSSIGYLFAFGIGVITRFEWKLIFMYPIVAMGTSLVCGLVWQYYENHSSTEFVIDDEELYDGIGYESGKYQHENN